MDFTAIYDTPSLKNVEYSFDAENISQAWSFAVFKFRLLSNLRLREDISGKEQHINELPRGFRNANPANIRRGQRWQGMLPVQNDKDFVSFEYVTFGIRALLRILRTYNLKYKLSSIRDVITRFAPPSENDTELYISSVVSIMKKSLGVDKLSDGFLCNTWIPGTFIPDSPALLYHLCFAICKMESGYELSRSCYKESLQII